MSATPWLVVHLAAAGVLTGVGWVVQLVVYPGFALVGPAGWTEFHARHTGAITRVVALPWLVQGISTGALLLSPPGGDLAPVVVLAALALVTVVATVAVAVPAHQRLADRDGCVGADLTGLLRANLVRTVAWTASTGLTGALLT